MSGKATPLTVPPEAGAFQGRFRIKHFDIIRSPEDREKYERLRTQANKVNGGVTIEQIRDINEREEVSTEETRVVNERWYILVAWWERDTRENSPDVSNGFYKEKKE